jgi:RNase H-fold protein (predicted Holliday junction resolvase)
MAFPVSVLQNSHISIREIDEIARQYNVKEIVLGDSLDYDMNKNQIYPEIEAFKKRLEDLGYVVHLELEFMTSIQATRIQGENKMLDASAATIILQSFIDRRKSER